jgi:S-disulfanyl-L-cysteine oxidoreductase SoxD
MTGLIRNPCVAVPLLFGLVAGSLQAQQGGDTVSVLAGVYSQSQAERGGQAFEQECSFCHAPAEFSGRIFQLTWQGRSVGALFNELRTTMPLDNPGSLTPDQYAAVVAYLLGLNRYPAGEKPLPADPDALNRIRIEPPPPASRR